MDEARQRLEILVQAIEQGSPFDLDGVVGILHALVVAPATVAPPAWLDLVFPGGADTLGDPKSVVAALRQLHGEIAAAVDRGQIIGPAAHEVARSQSFAAGYLAGAKLVPAWREHARAWEHVAWAAFLCGEVASIAPATLRSLEKKGGADVGAYLREGLAGWILDARDDFHPRATLADVADAPAPRAARVGRNDPCPCGSGKKYKRCCIGGRDPAA
ncbi:MAG: SEC-C domain-containing protein [Myxococcales bacterium]|nr:SEC-C domain-containing protein [Myxococcales bacterium]